MLRASSLSNDEFFHYAVKDPEVKQRVVEIVNDLCASRAEVRELSKQLEIAQEQVYFRNELLENILQSCHEAASKKQLVADIKRMLEESYVEL